MQPVGWGQSRDDRDAAGRLMSVRLELKSGTTGCEMSSFRDQCLKAEFLHVILFAVQSLRSVNATSKELVISPLVRCPRQQDMGSPTKQGALRNYVRI
ncbi:MAG TPA: hypothetical protein DEF45_16960 [Rhodopirellula sp.]|nr:hypothetical protein [Rhodopirellula sp.]